MHRILVVVIVFFCNSSSMFFLKETLNKNENLFIDKFDHKSSFVKTDEEGDSLKELEEINSDSEVKTGITESTKESDATFKNNNKKWLEECIISIPIPSEEQAKNSKKFKEFLNFKNISEEKINIESILKKNEEIDNFLNKNLKGEDKKKWNFFLEFQENNNEDILNFYYYLILLGQFKKISYYKQNKIPYSKEIARINTLLKEININNLEKFYKENKNLLKVLYYANKFIYADFFKKRINYNLNEDLLRFELENKGFSEEQFLMGEKILFSNIENLKIIKKKLQASSEDLFNIQDCEKLSFDQTHLVSQELIDFILVNNFDFNIDYFNISGLVYNKIDLLILQLLELNIKCPISLIARISLGSIDLSRDFYEENIEIFIIKSLNRYLEKNSQNTERPLFCINEEIYSFNGFEKYILKKFKEFPLLLNSSLEKKENQSEAISNLRDNILLFNKESFKFNQSNFVFDKFYFHDEKKIIDFLRIFGITKQNVLVPFSLAQVNFLKEQRNKCDEKSEDYERFEELLNNITIKGFGTSGAKDSIKEPYYSFMSVDNKEKVSFLHILKKYQQYFNEHKDEKRTPFIFEIKYIIDHVEFLSSDSYENSKNINIFDEFIVSLKNIKDLEQKYPTDFRLISCLISALFINIDSAGCNNRNNNFKQLCLFMDILLKQEHFGKIFECCAKYIALEDIFIKKINMLKEVSFVDKLLFKINEKTSFGINYSGYKSLDSSKTQSLIDSLCLFMNFSDIKAFLNNFEGDSFSKEFFLELYKLDSLRKKTLLLFNDFQEMAIPHEVAHQIIACPGEYKNPIYVSSGLCFVSNKTMGFYFYYPGEEQILDYIKKELDVSLESEKEKEIIIKLLNKFAIYIAGHLTESINIINGELKIEEYINLLINKGYIDWNLNTDEKNYLQCDLQGLKKILYDIILFIFKKKAEIPCIEKFDLGLEDILLDSLRGKNKISGLLNIIIKHSLILLNKNLTPEYIKELMTEFKKSSEVNSRECFLNNKKGSFKIEEYYLFTFKGYFNVNWEEYIKAIDYEKFIEKIKEYTYFINFHGISPKEIDLVEIEDFINNKKLFYYTFFCKDKRLDLISIDNNLVRLKTILVKLYAKHISKFVSGKHDIPRDITKEGLLSLINKESFTKEDILTLIGLDFFEFYKCFFSFKKICEMLQYLSDPIENSKLNKLNKYDFIKKKWNKYCIGDDALGMVKSL